MGTVLAVAVLVAAGGAAIAGVTSILRRTWPGTARTSDRLRALGLGTTSEFAARGCRDGVEVAVSFGDTSAEIVVVRAAIPIDLWLDLQITMPAFSRERPRVRGVDAELARTIASDARVASLLAQATTFGTTTVEDDAVWMRVEIFTRARLGDAIDCAVELAQALAHARWRLHDGGASLDEIWTAIASTLGGRYDPGRREVELDRGDAKLVLAVSTQGPHVSVTLEPSTELDARIALGAGGEILIDPAGLPPTIVRALEPLLAHASTIVVRPRAWSLELTAAADDGTSLGRALRDTDVAVRALRSAIAERGPFR